MERHQLHPHLCRCPGRGAVIGGSNRGLLRPRYLGGLAVLLLLLAGCQQTSTTTSSSTLGPKELPTSGPVAGAPGKLVYANGVFLRTYTLSTAAIHQLAQFPSGSSPQVPTVSPDGKRIAFSLYHQGNDSNDPASGIDLWVMNVDGSGQRTVLLHQGAGDWLINGAWSPDGSYLYFTHQSPDVTRIERVRLDGSERKVVVESGERPTVSRDGRWLAYLTDDPKTGSRVLAVAPLTGGNARTLLAGLGFKAIAAPVFAPDSSRLAFVGVGGPPQSAGSSTACCSGPLAWLAPAVASAHGVPWDLWVVNIDGTGLRRLTDIREDNPFPAWSPDGRWIALKGEIGLYLIDPEGKQVRRLAQELSSEGLSWLGS